MTRPWGKSGKRFRWRAVPREDRRCGDGTMGGRATEREVSRRRTVGGNWRKAEAAASANEGCTGRLA